MIGKTLLPVALALIPLFHCNAAEVYRNPIQLSASNLVFTKVQVNGRDVLALIDSGSFRTVGLSATLAEELKLTLTETTKIARRYEGKNFYLKKGQIESLKIGDYETRNVDVDVTEGDIEGISKQVGTDFGIILGWGFLSQFQLVVDYKNLSLQFGNAPVDTGHDRLRINFIVTGGVPVIKGLIDGQEMDLLFDTGAPVCNLDAGVASAAKGEKVAKELVIEQTKFPLEWRVKDLSAIKSSLNSSAVIGNNFLKDYAVYFDTKNKVIHLY